MIELDILDPYYVNEFSRFKDAPTHASMIMMHWSLPSDDLNHQDMSYTVMLRPRIEAAYIYGRVDEKGAFLQNDDDTRHMPVHAGVDMTKYDTVEKEKDIEAHKKIKEDWARTTAIRENLLAHQKAPHKDDPTKTIDVPAKKKNRFSETDLDVVFSHTDYRLRGRAVI